MALNEIWIAIIAAVAGTITGVVMASFGVWWRKKTSVSFEMIERMGRLKASNEKLWEKLVMIRKVAELNDWKFPDREWDYPTAPKEE